MLFEKETVALVTGASKGIGRAIALDLAREGASVIVNYSRSEEQANEVVESITAEGGTAVAHQADVADERAIKQMFRMVKTEFGRIDVLVNNAGITEDGFLMMMSARKFEDVMRVNLFGTFACSREALKIMTRQGGGSIVSISSVAGITGQEGQVNYSASKGGQIAFTKALAREGAPFNVRANVVAPGFVDTDMVKKMPGHMLALYTQMIPMKRVGRPEEVASVVSFIASSKASYMTGKVLVVDGGLALG